MEFIEYKFCSKLKEYYRYLDFLPVIYVLIKYVTCIKLRFVSALTTLVFKKNFEPLGRIKSPNISVKVIYYNSFYKVEHNRNTFVR